MSPTSTPDGAAPSEPLAEESEPPSRSRLLLDVVEQGGDWAAAGSLDVLVEDVATALSSQPEVVTLLPSGGGACVAFADDATVRELNTQYRKQAKATNVLSFPAGPVPASSLKTGAKGRKATQPRALGDIVLAAETVAAEAAASGTPLRHHIQHLVAHGVLHLLGFDHETDAEAEIMEDLERTILATLGIPDPYRL